MHEGCEILARRRATRRSLMVTAALVEVSQRSACLRRGPDDRKLALCGAGRRSLSWPATADQSADHQPRDIVVTGLRLSAAGFNTPPRSRSAPSA